MNRSDCPVDEPPPSSCSTSSSSLSSSLGGVELEVGFDSVLLSDPVALGLSSLGAEVGRPVVQDGDDAAESDDTVPDG